MSVHNTVVCDTCGQQFMLDDDMDLPPYWFAMQIIVCDGEGSIPTRDREQFMHFCSQECLASFCSSDELRERAATIDSLSPEEEDLEAPGDEDVV